MDAINILTIGFLTFIIITALYLVISINLDIRKAKKEKQL